MRTSSLHHLDCLRPEPHRAPEILDLLLLGQQIDHGMWRFGIHLGRVGPVETEHVTGELGDGDMHPQADPEIRDLALAGDATGKDLSLPPARSEPSGNEHPVDLLEQSGRFFE